MRQRMIQPLTRPRPTAVPAKGTLVALFTTGGPDGRKRTYKHLATGEPWKTVNLPHIMKREPGKPPVRTDDGYHFLPTKRVLTRIG